MTINSRLQALPVSSELHIILKYLFPTCHCTFARNFCATAEELLRVAEVAIKALSLESAGLSYFSTWRFLKFHHVFFPLFEMSLRVSMLGFLRVRCKNHQQKIRTWWKKIIRLWWVTLNEWKISFALSVTDSIHGHVFLVVIQWFLHLHGKRLVGPLYDPEGPVCL